MKQLTSLLMLIVSSTLAINSYSKQAEPPSTDDQRVWITIGSDVASKAANKNNIGLDLTFLPAAISKRADARVASLPANQIDKLSHFMHESFNRCGGFFFHESKQQAIAYANQAVPETLTVSYPIDHPDEVNQLLGAATKTNMTATVNALSSYHNRYYTQQSGVDAVNWIKQNWESIAQGRSDISVSLYNHSWAQPSIIATIQGTTNADEIVVIGGHLDSINQYNRATGRAPGMDDNASGIAVLTETLRAIVDSNYQPARTIQLMGYAAEEVGLRGSNAIASDYQSSNKNVVGVVQFDMTANKGTANRDIVFMTDYTNSGQNNFMMQIIDTYLPDIAYGTSQCGYGCSDHASWHNKGFAASMPFESNMSDANSRIHTANDTTFDVDHSYNFLRLSAAFVGEFASDGGDEPPPDDTVLQNGVPVTGLAASQGNDVTFTMNVPANATDISFNISGGSGDADLYVKFGSAPTDSTYDCRPYRNGNNETCNGSDTDGTYFVRVKAYRTFSGVSLVGSYTVKDDPPLPDDNIDETITGINVNQSSWFYHEVNVPAGLSSMEVSISGGSGDGDLYVRRGSRPTTSSYDCRPYRWGNNETCSFNNPAADVWHIGIRGYSNSSNITLTIDGTP